jgi:hypothetical protein
MTENKFVPEPDEQVMFERPHVVITDRRLFVLNGRIRPSEDIDMPLREVGTPKKVNGGQKNRRTEGAKLFGAGAVFLGLEIFIELNGNLDQRLEAVLFVVGALAAVIGLYFFLASLMQTKPNTMVLFPVAEGREVIVRFPDWDSPDADELTIQFGRAKRRL